MTPGPRATDAATGDQDPEITPPHGFLGFIASIQGSRLAQPIQVVNCFTFNAQSQVAARVVMTLAQLATSNERFLS